MNANGSHIIWSNENLDLEDWREDLAEEYPGYSDEELHEIMCDTNASYLEDERASLNIQLSQPILVIAELGLWNGKHTGYKEIESGNIRDCLYSNYDYTTWYVDKNGDFRCKDIWRNPRFVRPGQQMNPTAHGVGCSAACPGLSGRRNECE